jgi:hypothetical protein
MDNAIDVTNHRRAAHKHVDIQSMTDAVNRRTQDMLDRNNNLRSFDSTSNTVLEALRKKANERMNDIHHTHLKDLEVDGRTDLQAVTDQPTD